MLLIYLLNLLIHNPIQFFVTIAILIVPLFLSVSVHEWAHGYVAYKFGDMTPKMQGRLTLNPFAHLDPIGTLMLFIIGIGWAKPVMVNPLYFPSKTKQMLVALAGPASNFLLAVIFGVMLVALQLSGYNEIFKIVEASLHLIIRINLILGIFNLIPIPPLDGSKVLAWILPDFIKEKYLSLEPYGFVLVLFILFTVGFSFLMKIANVFQEKLLDVIKIVILTVFSAWKA